MLIEKIDIVEKRYDEIYQMERLYDLIRDMGLEIDPLCDNVFLKI